jgi:hypothetical protein
MVVSGALSPLLSPCAPRLILAVASSPDALLFLAELPKQKRRPNLFLAVATPT